MSGILKPARQIFGNLNCLFVTDHLCQRENRVHIFQTVNWLPSFFFRLDCHDMLGIGEKRLSKINRRRSAEYFSFESFFEQFWQTAYVVYMSMSQKHRVNFFRVKRKFVLVENFRKPGSLKHPAINQNFSFRRFQQITSSRNDSSSAAKFKFNHNLNNLSNSFLSLNGPISARFNLSFLKISCATDIISSEVTAWILSASSCGAVTFPVSTSCPPQKLANESDVSKESIIPPVK